jgi:uncharacterized damage-inducible protein DinB
MNKEIQSIIQSLQNTLNGQSWYGRPVYEILHEVDETKVYIKPNSNSHSIADLLYHMLTWAEFTQKRIEKATIPDMAAFEATDWRTIDPAEHTWKKGVNALKTAHEKIIELLQTKDDALLEDTVDYRKYNFRFLLNGIIQHNIYHLGQVVYVNKFLV